MLRRAAPIRLEEFPSLYVPPPLSRTKNGNWQCSAQVHVKTVYIQSAGRGTRTNNGPRKVIFPYLSFLSPQWNSLPSKSFLLRSALEPARRDDNAAGSPSAPVDGLGYLGSEGNAGYPLAPNSFSICRFQPFAFCIKIFNLEKTVSSPILSTTFPGRK